MMFRCLLMLVVFSQASDALLDDLGLGLNITSLFNRSNLPDLGSLLGLPWLGTALFGAPRCGPPATCPNYACRQNPAVVHGYCCGCASPFDRVVVPCPGNLQCPIYREPLCTDYRYMVDCCCRDL